MKRNPFILDILICTFSYSGLYYFKIGSFIPKGDYFKLFWVYFLIWIFCSFYYKKYKLGFNTKFRSTFKTLLFSSAFSLFFLTLIVSLTELKIVSRLFLISIVALPFFVELFVINLLSRYLSLDRTVLNDKYISGINTEKAMLRLKWLLAGFALLVIVFLIMVRIKTHSFGYYLWLEHCSLLLTSTWIISTGFTGKYKFFPSQNIYYQIAPFLKSGLIMFFLVGMVYYFFRLESLSRLVLFGTILVYVILETIVFAVVFIAKKESVPLPKEDASKIENTNIFGQESVLIGSSPESTSDSLIYIQSLFSRISIKNSDKIFQFLRNNIDCVYKNNSVTLISTTSLDNINVLQDQSQNLLINLHKLNDIRWLNEYLITCGDKINSGGMLFGQFIPLKEVRNHLQAKMPRLLFLIIFPFHFFYYRIFPKLPKIRHLYFLLTNGRDRVLSKAEVFGRLSFCGYKVIAEKLIGGTLYFIAQRLKTVSTEKDPSYGTIVNLKRVGLDGKIISIYKFRTMHPYSEFIQKELYENHSLNPVGKFKDDFRITSWGKVLRKLWIDELPQLYNWIRGDVNLVGVRALSEHYFSLYPKDLQELRTKLKPGLIPPYYADMPKKFDDIIESERKYLERKINNPFSTDFVYFKKVFVNIVFRGARSQ